MAEALSSVTYMGMLTILLMTMTFHAVNAVTAWNCVDSKSLTKTVKFSDITDKKLLLSLQKLGNKYVDELAYEYMGRQGYIAEVKEDEFSIYQCESKEAVLRPQDECYDRVPITIGKEKLFLIPWTQVITTTATRIPCNELDLQNYVLGSHTYRMPPRETFWELDNKKGSLFVVYLSTAVVVAAIVLISLLMLLGHVKHHSALHFFRRGTKYNTK